MKHEDKVAIVTGAAQGIGEACARRLFEEGAAVILADINGDLAQTKARRLDATGSRAIAMQCDVGRRSEVKAVVDQAEKQFGRIDILVNNAGGAFSPVERSAASKFTDEDMAQMFGVNYHSAVHCCQEAVPAMRAQGGGVIVNVATMVALDAAKSGANLVPYSVAKAAVLHYTRHLASELGPDGIRVNCLSPGGMLTQRIRKQSEGRNMHTEKEMRRIPLRRFGEVDDCANVLEFLVTPLSGYVTGQCISVCGGAVLTPS